MPIDRLTLWPAITRFTERSAAAQRHAVAHIAPFRGALESGFVDALRVATNGA